MHACLLYTLPEQGFGLCAAVLELPRKEGMVVAARLAYNEVIQVIAAIVIIAADLDKLTRFALIPPCAASSAMAASTNGLLLRLILSFLACMA